jgi:hypothetical protein
MSSGERVCQMVLLVSLVATGCGTDLGAAGAGAAAEPPDVDPIADETVGKVSQGLTSVLTVNFESSPLGPLGAPWAISSAGASSAAIIGTTDHGKALRLRGSTASGAFLVGALGLSSTASDINVRVDIRPNAGASFVWAVQGAGSSIGARRIRLQRAPNSTTLVASTSPSGNTDCGPLASNAWSTVTLVVHAQQCAERTFDVLINGLATSCTGLATGISAPYNAVSVMDASNLGWGGDVLFDNIIVNAP